MHLEHNLFDISFAAQAISLPIRFQRQSQMIPLLTLLRATVLSNSSHEKIIAQVNPEEI